MANTQSQFGFKHLGYYGGGAPDYQIHHYTIASTLGTNIGFGDPVGYVSGGSPFICQYTAANATAQPIVGIFQGCMYVPSGGGAPTWSPYYPGAAAQNVTAYVVDAPNAQFLVAALQTAITSANIGSLINFSTGAPQTTGGGFAVAVVDQSTATANGTTTALPFRVVDLYQGIGNGSDPTTNYNWVIVGFNYQLNRSNFGF